MLREEVLPAFAGTPIAEATLRDFGKSLGAIIRNAGQPKEHGDSTNWYHGVVSALLATVEVPSLPATYQVAACNALCGFLEQCLNSENPAIVSAVCSSDVQPRMVAAYLDRVDPSRASSLKQVFGTIVKLLAKSCEVQRSLDAVNQASNMFFKIVFLDHDRTRAKAACFALTALMKKGMLSGAHLAELYRSCDIPSFSAQPATKSDAFQNLLTGIFPWLNVVDVAPSAGQLARAFVIAYKENMSQYQPNESGDTRPIWINPLMKAFENSSHDLQAFRTHAFPGLFHADPEGYWPFLQAVGFEKSLSGLSDLNSMVRPIELDLAALYAALHAGKDCGLVKESSHSIYVHEHVVYIPARYFGKLCGLSSHGARKAGLSLLMSPSTSAKPLSIQALTCLRRYLPHVHSDADSNFRYEVQAMIRSFFTRLRMITSSLSQKATIKQKLLTAPGSTMYEKDHGASVTPENLLEHHRTFITWYLNFLLDDLQPHAPYQRHISAVTGLSALIRSGVDNRVNPRHFSKQPNPEMQWPFKISILNRSLIRLLFDLLLDPYDDVRQSALELFVLTSKPEPVAMVVSHGNVSTSRIQNAMKRAQTTMLHSGRVDHADGVARLHDLEFCMTMDTYHKSNAVPTPVDTRSFDWIIVQRIIGQLEDSLMTAETDLHAAVARYPVHGHFTAIRYVLERMESMSVGALPSQTSQLGDLLVRLDSAIIKTWNCMKSVLCDDAPEGFVPEELEDEADLTTKDILSYSWRALKESSLLVRTLVTVLPNLMHQAQDDHVYKWLTIFGDLCFTQLADLRHRGAFSAVAQTFSVLCKQCAISHQREVKSLLTVWYKRALLLITAKGSMITRRSAGLPAIIVALVGADLSSMMLEDSISDLKHISQENAVYVSDQENVELPQVHALNSLKTIFTTSKLGTPSQSHVVDIMHLAAESLSSQTWAIRNCGLMLFRSLIDRLLGSDESQHNKWSIIGGSGSRFSYEEHPGLLELLENLLRTTRATLSTNSGSNPASDALFPVLDILRRAPPSSEHRGTICRFALHASTSPSWHIRVIAARAFAALSVHCSPDSVLAELLPLKHIDPNEAHGSLLCVRYVSDRLKRRKDIEALLNFISVLARQQPIESIQASNPLIQATYLDVVNIVGVCILNCKTPGTHVDQHVYTLYERFITMSTQFQDADRGTATKFALYQEKIVLNGILSQIIYAMAGEQSHELLHPSALLNMPSWWLCSDSGAAAKAVLHLSQVLSDAHFEISVLFLETLLKDALHAFPRELWSAIQSAIVDIFRRCETPERLLQNSLIQSYFGSLSLLPTVFSEQAPSELQRTLALWAIVLSTRRYTLGICGADLTSEVSTWIRFVRAAIAELNDFPLRYSAALSLYLFARCQSSSTQLPESLIINLVAATYDTLVDDDEDIRDLGASTATALLNSQGLATKKDVVPSLACQALCAYLVRKYSKSSTLVIEALTRLTGQKVHKQRQWLSVQELLEIELKKEMSLFDEEKPNQYLDEVKEAETWSRILKHLDPTTCPRFVLHRFSEWVYDGLDAFLLATKARIDGPLGWTSKADIFALGMRVFCAADVLLVWRTRSRSVNIKGSMLQWRLSELAESGREQDVHGLWLSKIENILDTSVLQRVIHVKRVLEMFPTSVR